MGVYVGQNGGKKINIEMQNTYQEDWAERSLFYNCRMFTEGLKKDNPIVVNFNSM